MKVLLDTNVFLWLVYDPARLSRPVISAVRDPENECYLSVVSAWEIAVKHGLGKLPLPVPPGPFVATGREAHQIASLALEEAAALGVAKLPDLHRDPFDRMLISQAITHGLTLAASDQAIHRYAVPTLW